MTTALDIIKATAQQLDEPTTVVSAVGLKGLNNALDRLGWADGVLLLYSTEQSGGIDLNLSGKARLSESVVLGFALDCKRDDEDVTAKLDQLTALAVQFVQRLIRQEAFTAVPSNETINPINTQREAYEYNGQYALLTLSFNLIFDPDIETPECE